MFTSVALQLHGTIGADEWDIAPQSEGQTGTGDLGAAGRIINAGRTDQVAVYMSELRGGIEAMRRGAVCGDMTTTPSTDLQTGYGTPMMYCGMRFVVTS